MIHLSEPAQLLRLVLIEVKAWRELYTFQIEGLFKGNEWSKSMTSLDPEVKSTEKSFILKMNKPTIPCDAFFMRYLTVKADTLVEMVLENVVFSSTGMMRLTECIRYSRFIHTLYFSKNFFEDQLLAGFSSALEEGPMIRLENLSFVSNKLPNDWVLKLLESLSAIKSHKSSYPLKKIAFPHCNINDSCLFGVQELAQNYAHSERFSLDISDNPISEKGLLLISEVMARYQVINELNCSSLRNLKASLNGCKSLLSKLTLNSVIHDINFKENPVNQDGLRSVVNYLGNNLPILKLSISFNEQDSRFLHPFKDSLSCYGFDLEDEEKSWVDSKSTRLKRITRLKTSDIPPDENFSK